MGLSTSTKRRIRVTRFIEGIALGEITKFDKMPISEILDMVPILLSNGSDELFTIGSDELFTIGTKYISKELIDATRLIFCRFYKIIRIEPDKYSVFMYERSVEKNSKDSIYVYSKSTSFIKEGYNVYNIYRPSTRIKKDSCLDAPLAWEKIYRKVYKERDVCMCPHCGELIKNEDRDVRMNEYRRHLLTCNSEIVSELPDNTYSIYVVPILVKTLTTDEIINLVKEYINSYPASEKHKAIK